MRKTIVLLLAVFVLLAFPVAAGAQAVVDVELMQISFWPEYDQPGVLVIYDLILAEGSSLPMELTFALPPDAELAAVAVGGETGLLNAESSVEVTDDALLLTVLAESSRVYFEYYDSSLQIDGELRTFNFAFLADYPIADLSFLIKQPFDASDVQANLTLDSGEVNTFDGLVNYGAAYGAAEAGEAVDFSFSYNKASDTLSASHIQPADTTSSAATNTTSSSTALSDFFASIADSGWGTFLLGLGIGLLGMGGYSYWQLQNNSKRGKSKKSKAKPRTRKPAAKAKKPVFCHECGSQNGAGDAFCSECGTKLRK